MAHAVSACMPGDNAKDPSDTWRMKRRRDNGIGLYFLVHPSYAKYSVAQSSQARPPGHQMLHCTLLILLVVASMLSNPDGALPLRPSKKLQILNCLYLLFVLTQKVTKRSRRHKGECRHRQCFATEDQKETIALIDR
jgi:hypothetical protein